MAHAKQGELPVISDLTQFVFNSGAFLERLVFNHRAVVLPLMLTSILCEALMVWLGIGVKVATLPVIALGVGIGVDYALYVLTVILAKARQGIPLKQAYFETLMFTGRVVALILMPALAHFLLKPRAVEEAGEGSVEGGVADASLEANA